MRSFRIEMSQTVTTWIESESQEHAYVLADAIAAGRVNMKYQPQVGQAVLVAVVEEENAPEAVGVDA